MTNHAPDKDHYNTTFRECMKRSLEHPAGELKPPRKQEVRENWKLVLSVLAWALCLGYMIWRIVHLGHL